MINDDPTLTDPDHYRTLWENDLVRVLDYHDEPGDRTNSHRHPNSVMVTLTALRRHLSSGSRETDVALPAGAAVWLDAQQHTGQNTGDTPTHTILIELKGAGAGSVSDALGPED
ncbi:cytoplasmic protein [Microbacteriaceae bacterium VKM Ac-2855]|nr:cytoplasmic protein [Microbacteriaceae bacterium VKM Ac-2855]